MSVRLFRGEAEISRAAAQLMEAGMSASTLEERMRRGDLVAMLLTEAGELVAHSWTMFTDAWIAEVGATLRLRSDEMVRYDTLVMPKWRGKDLHLRFNIACYRYLREEGYRRTLFWMYALNTRSLKTQFRQGKRKIATIVSSPLRGIVRLKDVAHEGGITLKKKKPSLAMESPWAKSYCPDAPGEGRQTSARPIARRVSIRVFSGEAEICPSCHPGGGIGVVCRDPVGTDET
jgi:GNAT superfamily N-acetyltransferase